MIDIYFSFPSSYSLCIIAQRIQLMASSSSRSPPPGGVDPNYFETTNASAAIASYKKDHPNEAEVLQDVVFTRLKIDDSIHIEMCSN
jgi:hypothetical protein